MASRLDDILERRARSYLDDATIARAEAKHAGRRVRALERIANICREEADADENRRGRQARLREAELAEKQASLVAQKIERLEREADVRATQAAAVRARRHALRSIEAAAATPVPRARKRA